MPRRTSLPQPSSGDRNRFQYLLVFLTGLLTPYLGGVLSTLVSDNLWSTQANGTSNFDPTIAAVINSATFATVAVVYMAGFAVLLWWLRRPRYHLTLRNTAPVLIAVGILGFAACIVPLGLYRAGVYLSTALEIVNVLFFGFGYLAAWWLIRRRPPARA
jgi:hypothetical protein